MLGNLEARYKSRISEDTAHLAVISGDEETLAREVEGPHGF